MLQYAVSSSSLAHLGMVRETRYLVATSYKSVTNNRDYNLINGHYIIGMCKNNY